MYLHVIFCIIMCVILSEPFIKQILSGNVNPVKIHFLLNKTDSDVNLNCLMQIKIESLISTQMKYFLRFKQPQKYKTKNVTVKRLLCISLIIIYIGLHVHIKALR